MDNFLNLIHLDEVRGVLSGTFDLSRVPLEKHRVIFLMASHCCLNGPVGTNKVTTFPLVSEDTSISIYVGNRVSNNSWRSFCASVAEILKSNFHSEVSKSQQFKVMGDLWPLVESISVSRTVS
jgi:hypothetical protein